MNSVKTLHLIANTKSGKGLGASIPDIAREVCAEFGAECIHHKTHGPEDFEKQIDEALRQAKADGGVVVASGGDGTIRGVAQKAAGEDVTFAVVPCGTFNFFARNHRIPEDPREAFRLIFTGEVRPVRLGEINDHVFLINASLGLYAKAIREREMRTDRWGRNRIVVIISTIMSFFSKHRLLNVDLVTAGQVQSLRTPMIFIGNNALQLRDLAMDVARCMKKDLLAVVLMKKITKLELVRVIFRGIFKTIEKEERLDSFCVDSLTIHTHHPRQTVALDGEMFVMNSPLRVRAWPKALKMVLPPREAAP